MTSSPLRLSIAITALTHGGAQRLLIDFLKLLPGWVEPEVLCLYPGPLGREVRALGIPLREENLRGVASLRAVPWWTEHWRGRRPHIVHTNLGKADFVGRWAARRAGVPVVLTTSHNVEHWKKNPLLNVIDNWSLGMADGVAAVGREVSEFLVQRGVPADRLRLVHARVELRERFATTTLDPGTTSRLRRELDLPEGVRATLMVGRMHRQKAHEVAIQAFARLGVDRHVLLLAGDGPLRTEHEALARSLAPPGAVRFLGNRDDVPDLLRLVDMGVMPSRWEGAPLALMEAYAAGRAVAATSAPGIREVAADCGGSLLTPVDDAEALAGSWRTLLGNDQLRREMGMRARERALGHWDIRESVAQYLDFYRDLYRSKPSAPRQDLPPEFLGG